MLPLRTALRQPVYRCLNAPSTPRKSPFQSTRSRYNSSVRHGPRQSTPTRHEEFVSIHRAEAIRRAAAVKRRNWLALGAAMSMVAPIFLVQLWELPPDEAKDKAVDRKESRGIIDVFMGPPTKTDSPQKITEEFQGKKVVIAAGDKVIAAPASLQNPQASHLDAVELVETGTSYVPYFPRTINLPTNVSRPEAMTSDAEYTLLGLGIRKVSFLRVQVYVVGLYVKTADLATLQNHLINTVNPIASALIPGETESLRRLLLDAEESDKIWAAILSKDGTRAVDMAFRVVPCRGTDFKHLQDGWMRGIASRTDQVKRRQADLLQQQAAENKSVALPKPVAENEFSDESFGLAMKNFKNLFQGQGKAPKGSVIVLTRNKLGNLGVMYQPIVHKDGKETMGKWNGLGEVADERVSRLLWLIYLGGQNVSSEDARKSIVDGCIGIVERPVGTVEGMVQ